jgi:hypothetical protein
MHDQVAAHEAVQTATRKESYSCKQLCRNCLQGQLARLLGLTDELTIYA